MDNDVRIQPLSFKGGMFFFITGFIMLIFQTTILGWIDPVGYGPDLCLILVLYLGFNAPLISGAVLVTALGFLKDATGGGAFGLHSCVFLVLFLLAGQLRGKIDPIAPWYQVIFILVFTVLSGGLVFLMLYLLGCSLPDLAGLWPDPGLICLISAVLTALVGPILFWLLGLAQPLLGPWPEEEP